MEVLFEMLFEVIFECLFEVVIPWLIPKYSDKRKARIIKFVIIMYIYIIILVIGVINLIKNHNNIKSSMFFIYLVLFSIIMIIAAILRVKCYKLSIIYKLNFIAIFISFIISIVEAILLINSNLTNGKIVGIVFLFIGSLLAFGLSLYSIYLIKRSKKMENKVSKIIKKNEFEDEELIALNNYFICIEQGHEYYISNIYKDSDKELLQSILPKKLIDYLCESIDIINNLKNYNKLKEYDNLIKKYKNKLERYKTRLVYSKYYADLKEEEE